MKDDVIWVHVMQICGHGYHIVKLYGIFVEYVKQKLGESTQKKNSHILNKCSFKKKAYLDVFLGLYNSPVVCILQVRTSELCA
jgi:hypothetical protein